MDLTPTPPPTSDSPFAELADSLCSGVNWLESQREHLGEQGPMALEFMGEAAVNLKTRLEPEKVSPGSDIPDSVRIRHVRHDFRNLIAAVVGFAELLLLEDDVANNVQETLHGLKRDSRTFCDLLDDVRDSAA